VLRQERDQAIAQFQSLTQENEQLRAMISLTRSRLNEILVMASSKQLEEDEDIPNLREEVPLHPL